MWEWFGHTLPWQFCYREWRESVTLRSQSGNFPSHHYPEWVCRRSTGQKTRPWTNGNENQMGSKHRKMGRKEPQDARLTFYSLHPGLLALTALNMATKHFRAHPKATKSSGNHLTGFAGLRATRQCTRGFPWGCGQVCCQLSEQLSLVNSTSSFPSGGLGAEFPTKSHIIRFSWEWQIFPCLGGCPGAWTIRLITKMCLSAWDIPGSSQKFLCGSEQLPFKVMSF